MTRFLVLVAVLASGCLVGDVDDSSDLDTLAGGGDPCREPGFRDRANVRASDGGHRFVGTDRPDIIVATEGNDFIFGLSGDDIICGLGGDDFIDGGGGRDKIFADSGTDVVHGRSGSDMIWGGDGADVLFGDLLDDVIYGGRGNDVLVGGHGTDQLFGGDDNDYLRGDTGNDAFAGGDGYDIVSFATAMPPGQPEVKNDGTANTVTGVQIRFSGACGGGGCANGDGGQEPLLGVEEVVGSSFDDDIQVAGHAVRQGLGTDVLDGAATGTATPTSTVLIDAGRNHAGELIDVGIVVLGSPVSDDFQIVGRGTTVDISSATAITAVAPCVATGSTSVRCDVGGFVGQNPHRPAPFHYIVGWGGAGADSFELSGEFPRELEVHVNGGEGDDDLIGGEEPDVFFSGTSGRDNLEGRGGDDALLSESHHTLAWADGKRPRASTYVDGADILDGGDGNDQLVTDYVCGGHRYLGGPGHDIAGFARSGIHPIHAQLGGPSSYRSEWWGFAANMDLCGKLKGRWTSFRTGESADLEVLEASDGADYLWGDDRNDTIWGRGGGDHIFGLGGDDEILAADGNDVVDGGGGDDDVSYGRGE